MGRRRAEEPEEHENHERWLITYADMVTLLMVLFIVMFAMSQVDERKFNELRVGLAAGFGQSTSILDGSSSILDEPGVAVAEPINPQNTDDPAQQVDQVAVNSQVAKTEQQRNQRKYADAQAEVARLEKLQKRLMAALRKRHLQSDVRATIDERGLTVSLISKHVVFQPNMADLTPRGALIVNTLAPVLRDLPDPLEIDGHTNQVKVKPKFYPTDWELSSARAITVLRHLNEGDGIPDSRLSAVGFGHTKPLISPALPGSQRVNKRVDIVILPRVRDESKAMLDQAARELQAKQKGTSP
jgi:chemotaxis protein MotB